jgi:dTDP-4-dehydrorhamnose reductase
LKLAPTTRVFVTGASGSLGWTLCRLLSSKCRIAGTYFRHPRVPESTVGVKLDLADLPSISATLDHFKPEVIFHAAAITDPDRCEENPGLAFAVNSDATRELASVALRLGSRLIFVSTDLVFDGEKGGYTETDPARPLSVYGASKLRAEQATLERGAFVVIRSSLVYGFGSPVSRTFLGWMLSKLGRNEPIEVFADQKRNPVLVDDLAEAAVAAVEGDLVGLYHVGGPETMSRLEFGRQVCGVFGFGEALLRPTSMADFGFKAKRPVDSSLSTEKFTSATGFVFCPLRNALEQLKLDCPGS